MAQTIAWNACWRVYCPLGDHPHVALPWACRRMVVTAGFAAAVRSAGARSRRRRLSCVGCPRLRRADVGDGQGSSRPAWTSRESAPVEAGRPGPTGRRLLSGAVATPLVMARGGSLPSLFASQRAVSYASFFSSAPTRTQRRL